jgi:hypothetical protein
MTLHNLVCGYHGVGVFFRNVRNHLSDYTAFIYFFVVYLATPSATLTIWRRIIMIVGLERMSRKWSWPNWRYYPSFCLEILWKTTSKVKILSRIGDVTVDGVWIGEWIY